MREKPLLESAVVLQRLLSLREGVSPGAHRGEGGVPTQSGRIRFSIRVTTQAEVPLMKESTVAPFCYLDDFAKIYNDWQQHHLIPSMGWFFGFKLHLLSNHQGDHGPQDHRGQW